MAYRIIIQKRFNKKSSEVAKWIEKEWSKNSADKFVKALYQKIESLRQSPFSGAVSARKPNYRKLVISKHNKVYYRIKAKTIYIVDLIESRMDPRKNKYE